MKSLQKSLFFVFLMVFFISPNHAYSNVWNWLVDDFDVLMRTHGEISFSPYVHGEFSKHQPSPGYRSNFNVYVDFFEWKGFISNWLISNQTTMERSDSTQFRLDRIRYTLTPGYRIEFDQHLISGLLLHECVHTISKPEENGAIWWNSFQIGFGTKNSYPQYLVRKYKYQQNTNFPSLDYNLNIGAFLYGDQSVWIQQNHDYRYEYFYTLRLHYGKWGPWGFFSDLKHHSWIKHDFDMENKWSISAEVLLTGLQNIASVYYEYFFHDTFEKDNQDALGAAGFKIVF